MATEQQQTVDAGTAIDHEAIAAIVQMYILVPQSGALAAREALGTTAPPVGSAALPLSGNARPWVRALAAALAVLVIALVAAGVMAAIWP